MNDGTLGEREWLTIGRRFDPLSPVTRMLFSGFPEFYEATAACLQSSTRRNVIAAILCSDMADLVHAAQYALDHYFSVELSAHYLQQSSFGTPYEKWAHFTNEDFANVDACARALLRSTYRLWYGVNEDRVRKTGGAIKSVWSWFEIVHGQLRSCVVSEQTPELLAGGLAVPMLRSALLPLTAEGMPDAPTTTPALVFFQQRIEDRAVLQSLRLGAQQQVESMARTLAHLRGWVATNFTAAEIVTPGPGNSTDFSLEV